jgi:hypothetical protein
MRWRVFFSLCLSFSVHLQAEDEALLLLPKLDSAEAAPLILGTPFAEEAYWKSALAMPATFRLHGVFNLNTTNQFITNYGLILENQGVMIQPSLLLTTHLYAKRTSWVSEVVMTLGGWSSWHTRPGGTEPGHWRELDLYGGLTFTMARDWKLSVFYSSYLSQTASFPTAWDLAIALNLDDSRWLKAYALHPFIEFRRQTEGRNNVSFVDANTNESYLFKVGIVPAYVFKNGFKLELPLFTTLVPKAFYQRSNGDVASGGVAFISTALRASMPLRHLSTMRTHWSIYGAVQYYHLMNEGLLETNATLNNSTQRQQDIFQFHAGLTLSF